MRKSVQGLEHQRLNPRLIATTVALLIIACAPHFGLVGLPIAGLFGFCAVLRLAAIKGADAILRRLVIWPFALCSLAMCIYLYGPPLGRDPGIAFLVTMVGLKILELNTRRDLRVAVLLGYFLLMSYLLFEHQLVFVCGLLVLLLVFTWLLIQISHVDAQFQALADLKTMTKVLLQALPFALVLFFFLPRLSGALWLIQTKGGSAVTGQTETLQMGSLSELSLSEEIAFTVRFKDNHIPPANQRYWRGNVFWDTDGRNWVRGEEMQYAKPLIKPVGEMYEYEIELQPSNQNWLFTLDAPTRAPQNAVLRADFRATHHEKITQTYRYSAQSYAEYKLLQLTAQQEQRGLALTSNSVTPRITEFLERLSKQSVSDSELVASVLQHFNQQDFYYSLSPPLLGSSQPVDEFLFETRSGFCEHYASAFVTLMRAANIPSRIVVGYLGGEHNPLADQIVVRQSDSHAWAEIWLEGNGWTRIDPTAAVAPERIEKAIDIEASLDGRIRFLSAQLSGASWLFREIRWIGQAAKANWNRWFIHYNNDKQQSLLKKLRLQQLSVQSITLLAFTFGLICLNLTALLFFFRDKAKTPQLDRIYALFCKKMEKNGYNRPLHQGPKDFYETCSTAYPSLSSLLSEIAQHYIELKYGAPRPNHKDKLKALRTMVKQLKIKA